MLRAMTDAPQSSGEAPKAAPNPLVKLGLELGPLIVFFVVNAKWGIFAATGIFMVAAVASLGLTYGLYRKLPIMPLVTAGFVLVFGGLTLILQDELFIKLKPTIVNTLFGVILLGGLAFGKSFLKVVLESAFGLTDHGWRVLTVRWALFFFFLAIVNEAVWRNFSTDFWVSFKLFGIVPITILFSVLQLPLMNRHLVVPADGD